MKKDFQQPLALTLLELLVVMVIIAVLGGLLLGTMNRAKSGAEALVCMGNMRQIGLSVQLYTSANQGTLPFPSASYSGPDADPKYCWFNAIDPYALEQMAATTKSAERLHLIKQDPIIQRLGPEWFSNAHTIKMNQRLGEDSLGNPHFYKMVEIQNHGLTVMFFDGRAETEKLTSGLPAIMAKNPQGTEGYVARRHFGGANVFFLDGHGEMRDEKHQTIGNGLGWAIDRTRLIWKPWTNSVSN